MLQYWQSLNLLEPCGRLAVPWRWLLTYPALFFKGLMHHRLS
jgi:hypothetical protein